MSGIAAYFSVMPAQAGIHHSAESGLDMDLCAGVTFSGSTLRIDGGEVKSV